MPYPVSFKMVWWHQSGNNSIYIWKPIPASLDFVAMGVVITPTSDEPSLDCVRCVNKGFLVPTKAKPQRIWDSSGIGGKKGSFWIMNSLQLLAVTEGFDPPQGEYYELKAPRLITGDLFVLSKGNTESLTSHEVPTKESPPELNRQLKPPLPQKPSTSISQNPPLPEKKFSNPQAPPLPEKKSSLAQPPPIEKKMPEKRPLPEAPAVIEKRALPQPPAKSHNNNPNNDQKKDPNNHPLLIDL